MVSNPMSVTAVDGGRNSFRLDRSRKWENHWKNPFLEVFNNLTEFEDMMWTIIIH